LATNAPFRASAHSYRTLENRARQLRAAIAT
jgi:hypothetical protein